MALFGVGWEEGRDGMLQGICLGLCTWKHGSGELPDDVGKLDTYVGRVELTPVQSHNNHALLGAVYNAIPIRINNHTLSSR